MKMRTIYVLLFLLASPSLFAQEGACLEMKLSSPMGANGTILTYFSPAGHRT